VLFVAVLVTLFAFTCAAGDSDTAKVDEALSAKKAAIHKIATVVHDSAKAVEPKKVAPASNWPGDRKEEHTHHVEKHLAMDGSAASGKHAAESAQQPAHVESNKVHEQHEAHAAATQQTKASPAAAVVKQEEAVKDGKPAAAAAAQKAAVKPAAKVGLAATAEKIAAAKKEAAKDPRMTNHGKFGWLFKGAEKEESKLAPKIALQGGENATDEEGGGEESGEDEDANAQADAAMAEQKKKNKEEAAKALSFSEKREVKFVVSLLVAIVVMTLIGLCCIQNARLILTGQQAPSPRTGKQQVGPNGQPIPNNQGPPPPGHQYQQVGP